MPHQQLKNQVPTGFTGSRVPLSTQLEGDQHGRRSVEKGETRALPGRVTLLDVQTQQSPAPARQSSVLGHAPWAWGADPSAS